MKKKAQQVVALFLMAALLVCPAFASSFPDVDDDAVYADAVEFVNETGIMVGDDKGNFNPDKTVTRAEMATIICRMLGEMEGLTTSNDFTDVPTDHWANAYISKAAELGIVGGYGNGKFGPSDAVTYEQALAMLVRAVELEDVAIELGGYPDGYIEVAQNYGYIYSVSAEIGDFLLRKQVAMIIYNMSV